MLKRYYIRRKNEGARTGYSNTNETLRIHCWNEACLSFWLW